ncbi:MAG TPA: hypothetical protein PLZ05_00335 [Alphaproteobacteria bacterium]|nr:hypothetical protein [Alphaproteobacteria bacterium]
MLKKILFVFYVFVFAPIGILFAEDDPFSLKNFAIEDSDNADITTTPVSMNMDSAPVNVSGFDIAGVMLGMPFEDVQTLFFKTKSLYVPRKKDSIIYTMHKDWKYNLDYECRQQKIYAPAELEKCINTLATNRGLMYASELHLERNSTGETVDIYFTSNATDNLVWRIVYNNDVNNIEGADEKFENQRQKKILAFWQGVLDKYGAPNSGNDKWISSGNAYDPMMTAYYGSLDLVDMGRNASDAAKNVQEARENFRAKPYAF